MAIDFPFLRLRTFETPSCLAARTDCLSISWVLMVFFLLLILFCLLYPQMVLSVQCLKYIFITSLQRICRNVQHSTERM